MLQITELSHKEINGILVEESDVIRQNGWITISTEPFSVNYKRQSRFYRWRRLQPLRKESIWKCFMDEV
jgi:hypothetical protein